MAAHDQTAADRSRAARRRPGTVLAMLLLVYSFNFVDRQIVGILAAPIKAEFALSDRQLGALGGLAFALLYSLLGIPLAWLADRTRRTWVIAGALAVWSGFTALCGLAGGFAQLFAFRLGVGVGEAGGAAPSYALIADVYPPGRRARALAIYSLGIPLGSAAGALLGGTIAALVDWRAAFIAVGLAGLALAPVFARVVGEPPRAAAAARVDLGVVIVRLARCPSFRLLSLGAASTSVIGYGIGFWLPSLLMRSYGFDLRHAAGFVAGLVLVGGAAGMVAGGWLADRLGASDRGAYARVPGLALLAAVPLYAAALLTGRPALAFALFLLPQALAYAWFGPILAAVQHLAPPAMRATAAACFLAINNLVGLGLGAPAIGALSDALTPRLGGEALRWALIAGLACYLAGGALLLAAARRLPRDWIDDAAAPQAAAADAEARAAG